MAIPLQKPDISQDGPKSYPSHSNRSMPTINSPPIPQLDKPSHIQQNQSFMKD
jgi:hypothetical protein